MPAVKGKRQERGLARRQQILDAAVALMSSRGYRGTALATLAEEVEISGPAAILHYFGSKEQLLVAVLEQRERRDAPEHHAWASAGGVRALRRLPKLAESIVETPAFARLLIVLQAEHLDDDGPIHDWFVARGKRVRKMFADVLRRGAQGGEFRADLDPELKAVEIVAFLDGVALQWFLDSDAFDLVEAYRSYSRSLVRELTA